MAITEIRQAVERRQIPTLDMIQDEILAYAQEMAELANAEPGQAFQRLAAIGGRLAELRILCWRTNSQKTNALRTREIDPLLEAAEFIFKNLSRCVAVRQMESDLSRGGV